jgi:hypothetical protein
MFIILTGDPWRGFTGCGPYETADEASNAGDAARCEYGGEDWFVFPLTRTAPCPARRTAKQWRREAEEAWVRFSGRLDRPWKFSGPYDADRPRDLMLQLQPLELEDESNEPRVSGDADVSQR